MSRKAQAPKRVITPDAKYNSLLVSKFVNLVMRGGKKSVAERVVWQALDIIKEKSKKEPLMVFEQAIKNVAPVLEVKGRRVGGANYQIPFEVRGDRRNTLAFRWIITSAKRVKGKPMGEKLAQEVLDAFNKQGAAMKKKEDVHRMAEANRAFAHFA